MIVHYKKYQCRNCGKEDTVKYFENEKPPDCFNCYDCHDGSQQPTQQQQLHAMTGMFPVEENDPVAV